MKTPLIAAVLLAGASLLGAASPAAAAETRLLHGTATGLYAKFYYVAEEANAKVLAECASLSGTPAVFFTIENAVREGENVTVTVSRSCTI